MSDYGIKVSQPGFDVKTATAQQVSFTSKWFLWKVFAQGSSNITVPRDGALHTTTVAHNLGYRPAFFLFSSDVGNSNRYMTPFTGTFAVWGKCDNSNLTIGVSTDSAGGNGTITVYYYIFYDSGAS